MASFKLVSETRNFRKIEKSLSEEMAVAKAWGKTRCGLFIPKWISFYDKLHHEMRELMTWQRKRERTHDREKELLKKEENHNIYSLKNSLKW